MTKRTQFSAFLLVALACIEAGCGGAKTSADPPTPVRVRPVEMFSGSDELHYSGHVEPQVQVTAAFRVGGYVERVADIDEGDRVAAGTVLAALRAAEYAAKVNQAEAQAAEAGSALESAKSQLAEAATALHQAEVDFKRAQNLFESQSLTKADYDAARTKLDIASARRAAAAAQIKAIESRGAGAAALAAEAGIALKDTSLTAPIDGVVLKRLVERGSLVGPGTPAFALADIGSVKVIFGVPDTVLASLKTGAVLPVRTEALPGAEFSGRIATISPSADPRSRLFEVELRLANRDGRLKPGMIASVVVSGGPKQPVPVLPLAAVVRSPGGKDGYSAFVVDDASGQPVARIRHIELGEAFGNTVAVTRGLRAGERVITNGSTLVRDGERVVIAP